MAARMSKGANREDCAAGPAQGEGLGSQLETICENGAPHRDTRENTFHSNWCHPLKIKVILDSKTHHSGFQEQKFPAFPYWGGDFRGPLGQAFPLSTLACLRARRVYLRHHFIKNALPVSCLLKQNFRRNYTNAKNISIY